MAACSNPPGPQAPSTMTPVLAVEKIPWNFTGEAETTSAGVQLAWHAIDLGSDYTTVVYSLHAASAAAVAGPPQLAQAWLRLDEGVTLESIACAAPTDCLGVTIGAVQFPGRSAPAAFLELKINELRAGETTLTGEWRLRPLVNADPASDRISGAYVFPRPEVLHSDGVAIVYGFDGRAPVADGSSPGGAFPFISPLPLAPDAAQPGQPAATATPAPRRAGGAATHTLWLEELSSGQACVVTIDIGQDGAAQLQAQTMPAGAVLPLDGLAATPSPTADSRP